MKSILSAKFDLQLTRVSVERIQFKGRENFLQYEENDLHLIVQSLTKTINSNHSLEFIYEFYSLWYPQCENLLA